MRYINIATPIAIVEAKDANHSVSYGMTATPKETRYQSNITYFGEPPFRNVATIGST